MAKTAAERQAAYRLNAAAKKEKRINTFVRPDVAFALNALADYHGLDQRQVIESLLSNAYKNLFRKSAADDYLASIEEA